MNDYISHFGIQGMKWGVRRYQNGDGSYNSAGKVRYADRSHGTPAQDKINNFRDRTLKSIKQSKAEFDTYVLGKNEVDTIIKKGTKFSRVQSTDKFENFGAYYATYKKGDVDKYIGLFGKNLKSRANAAAKHSGDKEAIDAARNMKIYQLKLSANKNIKVASDSNAANIAHELTKDKSFKDDLIKSIDHSAKIMRRPQQQRLFMDAKRALNKDPERRTAKDKENIYKAMNLTLTNHEDFENNVQNKFYGAMRKKGYGAITDLNDQSYSSYHAKKPMIVFANKSSTKVDGTREIGQKEMDRKYAISNTMRIVREAVIAVPQTLKDASYVGISKVHDYASTQQAKKAEDYIRNGYTEQPEAT